MTTTDFTSLHLTPENILLFAKERKTSFKVSTIKRAFNNNDVPLINKKLELLCIAGDLVREKPAQVYIYHIPEKNSTFLEEHIIICSPKAVEE